MHEGAKKHIYYLFSLIQCPWLLLLSLTIQTCTSKQRLIGSFPHFDLMTDWWPCSEFSNFSSARNKKMVGQTKVSVRESWQI